MLLLQGTRVVSFSSQQLTAATPAPEDPEDPLPLSSMSAALTRTNPLTDTHSHT